MMKDSYDCDSNTEDSRGSTPVHLFNHLVLLFVATEFLTWFNKVQSGE